MKLFFVLLIIGFIISITIFLLCACKISSIASQVEEKFKEKE